MHASRGCSVCRKREQLEVEKKRKKKEREDEEEVDTHKKLSVSAECVLSDVLLLRCDFFFSNVRKGDDECNATVAVLEHAIRVAPPRGCKCVYLKPRSVSLVDLERASSNSKKTRAGFRREKASQPGCPEKDWGSYRATAVTAGTEEAGRSVLIEQALINLPPRKYRVLGRSACRSCQPCSIGPPLGRGFHSGSSFLARYPLANTFTELARKTPVQRTRLSRRCVLRLGARKRNTVRRRHVDPS